jgi:hypothetical protein
MLGVPLIRGPEPFPLVCTSPRPYKSRPHYENPIPNHRMRPPPSSRDSSAAAKSNPLRISLQNILSLSLLLTSTTGGDGSGRAGDEPRRCGDPVARWCGDPATRQRGGPAARRSGSPAFSSVSGSAAPPPWLASPASPTAGPLAQSLGGRRHGRCGKDDGAVRTSMREGRRHRATSGQGEMAPAAAVPPNRLLLLFPSLHATNTSPPWTGRGR